MNNNGHGNGVDRTPPGPPPEPPAPPPLSAEAATEIRRGVGRLINGANELGVIALVSPVFLLGAFLAAQGFANVGTLSRTRAQRPLDYALFGGYALALFALAIRARLGAARARKLLPDALSNEPAARASAKARMLRLAGPAPVRRAADWIATRGCLLIAVFAVLAVVAWLFLPVPDPIWLVVFVGTAVAMDVRWRALVADVADQMP